MSVIIHQHNSASIEKHPIKSSIMNGDDDDDYENKMFHSFVSKHTHSHCSQFVRQMTKMRVCVIGAGESGLPAIKECLDAGFDVVAYERTSDIGGRWNHRPNFKEGGNVAKSTFSNISKEMMAYSIFTPSENCPNFMHNSVFCQYLKDYAENFDLLKDIRLNTSVEKVQRADNKWEVTTNDGKKETFEFVLICTGRYSIPKLPEIKGIEGFQGRVLHSRDFIDAEAFRNKNIFIVGIGNSALEIAVEAAAVAKSVTISTRRGSWIQTRLWSSALPYDVALNSRFYKALYDILPWTILNDYMEHHYEDGLSHELYGLRPQHRFFQQTFTICDSLPDLACSGAIIITEGVDHVDATGVVVDGDRHFPADVIILATGYSIQFPFLYPESLIDIKENDMNLYKLIFPPEHPSLAVIGFAQPRMGGIAPIAEMQSRLAAAVFSGQVKLPAKSAMVNDINIRRSALSKSYYKSPRNALSVDYISYMDELAVLVGCKPRICKYTFCDPRFAMRLFVGPNVPYVYRLQGKGRWEGAKNAIRNVPNRVKIPMKNRNCFIEPYKEDGNIDHRFRYSVLKILAVITCILLMTALWSYVSAPREAFLSYTVCVIVFLSVYAFIMLWFDKQFGVTSLF